MNPAVSEETLHAFIDDELTVVESEALIVRMRNDPELAQRVCALRALGGMIRLAYADPPVVARRTRSVQRQQLARSGALGCLMLLAGAGGWVARGLEAETPTATVSATIMPDAARAVSLAQPADPDRLMLHLDSDNPARMEETLDRAEALLGAAASQGRSIQIQIVLNSQGVNLVLAGVSPHARRLARMAGLHTNLHFVACSQTIARFHAQGQRVELLPVATQVPTAIGEIVNRLQQGWTYVKV